MIVCLIVGPFSYLVCLRALIHFTWRCFLLSQHIFCRADFNLLSCFCYLRHPTGIICHSLAALTVCRRFAHCLTRSSCRIVCQSVVYFDRVVRFAASLAGLGSGMRSHTTPMHLLSFLLARLFVCLSILFLCACVI